MSARQVTSHTSHVRASIMFMFICFMFMWLHAFSSEHCPTVPRLCYDCVYCSLRKTRGRTQSCTMCMGHGRLVRCGLRPCRRRNGQCNPRLGAHTGRRARLASRASSHALPQSRPQPPLNHCASMPTAEAMAVTCAMCARDVQMMDSTASWRWDWVRFWRFGAATLLAA